MNETFVLERIHSNLTRLRLPRIKDILLDFIKIADENGKSYLTIFDELLEEEVAEKEQRRIEASLRISGLPFIKTIDEYDFPFQPKLDQKKVMALFDLTFIQQKGNVILLGPPGVGKTHLAVALAVKACHAGQSIYFTTMAELIPKLKKDHEGGRLGKGRSYFKSALVIVDEVGYTPISRDECHLFYRFITARYERSSTIITSNKAFSEWTELFEDPIIVTALLDRLLHHSVIVNISGPSFRLKGKQMEEEQIRGPKK